jgi:hypothetical protein
VAVEGGNVNRRNAVVVALVDVGARIRLWLIKKDDIRMKARK